jgi:uncharacterized protein YxeA
MPIIKPGYQEDEYPNNEKKGERAQVLVYDLSGRDSLVTYKKRKNERTHKYQKVSDE